MYVHLNGKPPYRQADLDWLVQRLDEQIADHEARNVAREDGADRVFPPFARPALGAAAASEGCQRQRRSLRRARNSSKRSPFTGGRQTNRHPRHAHRIAGRVSQAGAGEVARRGARRPLRCSTASAWSWLPTSPTSSIRWRPASTKTAACTSAEMIDYPYRPEGRPEPLGRVRYLEDTDGDGRYEQSSIFADKHRLAHRRGLLERGRLRRRRARHLVLEGHRRRSRGRRRARRSTPALAIATSKGGVNNLNWHIDHTIYGSGSTNGGDDSTAPTSPTAQPIVLSSRDFRFDPVIGAVRDRQRVEAIRQRVRRLVQSLPVQRIEAGLSRRAAAALPGPQPAPGRAQRRCKDLAPGVTPIFRTSPIERWREIRSSRRLAAGERSPKSAGLSHNVIDAAAGLTIYRGHAYPAEYLRRPVRRLLAEQPGSPSHGDSHGRDVSLPSGPTQNTEFVRSTDTWFRPVNCINAPDGTLYVLDMSREVIESIHIAHDVVKHLDLTSGRDKGRIYRLAPPGFQSPPQPRPGPAATSAELVDMLEHPGGWWRDTASRLIFERQDRSIVEPLHRKAQDRQVRCRPDAHPVGPGWIGRSGRPRLAGRPRRQLVRGARTCGPLGRVAFGKVGRADRQGPGAGG